LKQEKLWITLIGGPAGRAGWRAVFPNEKHELSAGCTKRRTGGLRKTAGQAAKIGQPSGLPFSTSQLAVKSALMCSPLARPVVQLARPSVQLASPWKIHVFHWATRASSPPGPPFSVIESY